MTRESRPKLSRKARLRFDRKSERFMLLFPEKGLLLSPTAAAVLRLCTGERTVGAIVDELLGEYVAQDSASLEREVLEFLGSIADRALLEEEAR